MKEYEDDFDELEQLECPECGSYHIRSRQILEGQDADGNRGHWVTIFRCLDCGYEE